MKPEALQYLQRRLDDVRNLRLPRFGRDRPDVVSGTLASAAGALEALRDLGLISDDELTEWNARFWDAITEQPLPNVPAREETVETETSAVSTAVAVAAPVPGFDMPPLPTPRFEAIGFRRLIAGPDEEKTFGAGVLRILALIEFEDGVEVDWLFSLPRGDDTFAAARDAVASDLDALPPAERARRLRDRDLHLRHAAAPREFALSDDVGTSYQREGGGWHGHTVTVRGRQGFAPTLAPEATEVYVDADGARFTVRVG